MMNRSSNAMPLALAALAGILFCGRPAEAEKPQYYELRVYSTSSARQQNLVNDYWLNAAVPAYNRMGIKPIGVFTGLKDSTANSIYVLIPFEGPEGIAAVPERLAADPVYQAAAAGFMGVPKSEPAFDRIESTLLVAFDGMKRLAPPPSAEGKKPWIFELRDYWSHSESKGINKVDMFNNGEIDLMREVGLCPVFYGRVVAGPRMPNMVYMISGENMEEHQKHWKLFGASPVWKKLIGDPQYADNVSNITNVFLKRTSASQI
jgi:hypothetical protein